MCTDKKKRKKEREMCATVRYGSMNRFGPFDCTKRWKKDRIHQETHNRRPTIRRSNHKKRDRKPPKRNRKAYETSRKRQKQKDSMAETQIALMPSSWKQR